MSHATIFVKDSVDFNENLASFIGDRGAEYFLRSVYGEQAREYRQYIAEDHDYILISEHMLRGATYLDSLYESIKEWSVDEKKSAKEAAIRRVIEQADTLSLMAARKPSERYKNALPNNAYFMMYIHYQSGQEELNREWKQTFDGDLRAYIHYLSKRYPYL